MDARLRHRRRDVPAGLDGTAGRHQRLPGHLPAEDPLRTDLGAVALELVGGERPQVEQFEQLVDGRLAGHQVGQLVAAESAPQAGRAGKKNADGFLGPGIHRRRFRRLTVIATAAPSGQGLASVARSRALARGADGAAPGDPLFARSL